MPDATVPDEQARERHFDIGPGPALARFHLSALGGLARALLKASTHRSSNVKRNRHHRGLRDPRRRHIGARAHSRRSPLRRLQHCHALKTIGFCSYVFLTYTVPANVSVSRRAEKSLAASLDMLQ